MSDAAERHHRSYSTADVVIRFAQQGVAIDTMAHALMVPVESVTRICQRAKEIGHIVGMPPEKNETAADRKLALRTEVVNLREQLIDARDIIAELREPKREIAFDYERVAHFTRYELQMLVALATAASGMSKERLYNELYGARHLGEMPEPKIIDVFICKLRRKLLPFGVTISTRWGHGYFMDAESIAELNRLASGGQDGPIPMMESPALAPVAA